MTIKKSFSGVMLVATLLCLCCQVSNAQQKKGDIEIIGSSSSGFGFTFSRGSRPRSLEGSGYKYFLSKTVALDFSVGYSFDINKVNDSNQFFITDRSSSIDGRVGLSFVF